MTFRASFSDPFNAQITELGSIEKGNIISLFENTPWNEILGKMKTGQEAAIYYPPTLEIENTDNQNGLCIAAIDGTKWDIFYKRPKLKRLFFGLYKKTDNNYITDCCVRSEDEVKECLTALMNNDLSFLENKINGQSMIAPFVNESFEKD